VSWINYKTVDTRKKEHFNTVLCENVEKNLLWNNSLYFLNIQWKPLIMIILGLALFDNNNRLITLSEGHKNLHYLTQFIVTVQPFTCIQNNKIYFKKLM